jgi:hypothetical protein
VGPIRQTETTFHSLAVIGTSRARQPEKPMVRPAAISSMGLAIAASMSQVRVRHCGSGRGLFRNVS